MRMMAQRGVRRYLPALAAVGIALSLGQACARSGPSHAPDTGSSVKNNQQLPFHPPVDPSPIDPSAGETAANEGASAGALPAAKPSNAIPFREAAHVVLPTGTLLTVQLETPLSTRNVGPGDTFAATMASPVVIEGDTLLAHGAAVTGRVESAQSDSTSGYFRLVLSTVTVQGAQVPVQTSSLFAKAKVNSPRVSSIASSGTAKLNRDAVLRVKKGRQLTFRLTSPVILEESNASMRGQSGGVGPSQGSSNYLPK